MITVPVSLSHGDTNIHHQRAFKTHNTNPNRDARRELDWTVKSESDCGSAVAVWTSQKPNSH